MSQFFIEREYVPFKDFNVCLNTCVENNRTDKKDCVNLGMHGHKGM